MKENVVDSRFSGFSDDNNVFVKNQVPEDRKIMRYDGATSHSTGKSLSEMATDAVLSSFHSIIVIGGFIILFMIFTDAVERFLVGIVGKESLFSELVAGIFEMTVGCSATSGFGLTFGGKIIACTFMISFGGLSVAVQSMSVLRGAEVKVGFYLRFKLIQGLISALCACTIIKILSYGGAQAVSVFETTDLTAAIPGISVFGDSGTPAAAYLYSLVFSSATAVIMIIVFYLAVFLFSGGSRYTVQSETAEADVKAAAEGRLGSVSEKVENDWSESDSKIPEAGNSSGCIRAETRRFGAVSRVIL